MDFKIIIGFAAPLIVIFLTQILKKWINSKWAPLIVFVLGGISTLIGVGPTAGGDFIDSTINVAWVSGGATLIYDLVKKFGGVKATKLPVLLLAFILAFSLTACAGFESNTYRTMYTLGTTYNAAMQSAGDLYRQGKMSDEQAQKIIKSANIFYASYQEAVVAFEVYKKTNSADVKEKLTTLLKELSQKYAEIFSYIEQLKN
jgi:hypothetical protein